MELWFVARNLRKSMSSLGLMTDKDVEQGCVHQTPKYYATAKCSSR